ncbi:MAG: ABC transporter substrate-binding protein [Eubacteriales bacterium]|nr:ABC transporter substrate-binding protein [Eubacteriales bacterium]
MRKRVALTLVLVVLVLSGCVATDNKGPITLTDDFDREIVLEEPAQKIISLVPSSTEILFALGVGDRVVGASDFCNYPEEALSITRVGGFDVPNLELIVSLEPDLVFAASLHKETVEALEGMGIAVLALDPQNIQEIYANIQLMAKAVGKKKAGEDLIKDMQERLAKVAETVATLKEAERPVVFYEVWYPGIMVAGEGTFIDEIITLAGGKNMAWGIPRWGNIQEEEILARNPDFLIHGYPDTDSSFFTAREGWEVVTAVAEDRIFFVNPDITSRTGPRIADAVEAFARILHPELFK